MNRIEWIVGNKYAISDMSFGYEGILEGFIVNQCPVHWKDQSSYRNRADNTVYLVFSFISDRTGKTFVIATPDISTHIPETNVTNSPLFSEISLYGIEYSDSIEGLLKKLRENRVFTKELTFDAKYKEGFKSQI